MRTLEQPCAGWMCSTADVEHWKGTLGQLVHRVGTSKALGTAQAMSEWQPLETRALAAIQAEGWFSSDSAQVAELVHIVREVDNFAARVSQRAKKVNPDTPDIPTRDLVPIAASLVWVPFLWAGFGLLALWLLLPAISAPKPRARRQKRRALRGQAA